MNSQKNTPECVLNILKKNNIQFMDINYYAYPQTFGSTAGPYGGIGGCTMTSFTIESYVCDNYGPTVHVCGGMYYLDESKFEPFKSIKGPWRKLKDD